MFLSKIFVEDRGRNNTYNIHKKIWQLFPNQPDAARTFLFRVETHRQGVGYELLMQSQCAPADAEKMNILGQKEFRPNFILGQRLRFRLRANPTKTIKDPSKGNVTKKGKTSPRTVRVPLIHDEQQRVWLMRKMKDVTSLQSLIVQPERALYFRKAKTQHSGKIQPVIFEGVFEVKNVEAFQTILEAGIGPAKAFGCGLLSLAAM
ncbi:MAG: type I-E CRISPR-associated protein Cas6/Cse3/CasE [Pseudomonadales bacterium]|nr:type I-E CRISPR-associated protein Cas6/Cse3/CasE [Pseudomonadales bacterium]